MSVDVSTLEIRVISDAVEQAEKRLKALEDQAGNTERGAGNLTGGFAKLAASVAATVSVMQGFEKLVQITREFDILNAGLVTATGSAEGAKIAFDALQNFAATTPYDLQQVTQGFTKLVNYGLNPSEKALVAYGDTASAMGKSLNDMIEAVADASTGEFERLKEFGIRAAKQGDEVAFTFRGVTTTVRNSSEEIQSYLMQLGENNFAGAMAARMDTLDGALSNLSDSWDALFRNISQQGVGDAMADGVNVAIDALNHLNKEISSGKLEARLDAWSVAFRSFASDSSSSFGGVVSFISEGIEKVYELNNERWKLVFEAFLKYPDVINVVFTTAAAHLNELAGSAVITFEALKQSLNPFDDVDIATAIEQAEQKQKELEEQTRRTISDKIALLETEHYFQSMLNTMLDEEIAKREELQKANQGDPLARFQVAGTGVAGGSASAAGSPKKGAAGAQERGPNDSALSVENLALKLQQEEQLFSESYARRYETQSAWDVINDQAMSTTFSRRMEQLAAEDEAMRARSQRLYAEAEGDYQRSQNQLQAWRTSGLITEQRYNQLSEQNLLKYTRTKEQIDRASQQRQLSNASVFAGAALNIASTLFAENKPIAIASALVSTYQGAANALAALPPPANLAAAATVVAAGIAQVNNIRSTNIGGGGGGGAGFSAPAALPGTAGNDLSTSTLPATATQSESNTTRTIYIAHEINGRPAGDDDVVRLGSLRPLIEALNEEIKFGNLKVVM